MSFPPIRLKPLLYLIILSLPAAPWLPAQTPTPTPPVDTDGDGVPDHQDGWPEHKQLSSPRVPEFQYVVVNFGPGIGYGINNRGDVVGEGINANGEREAILWRLGQPPTFLGFLTQDQNVIRRSTAWGINDAQQITGGSTYTWDPDVLGEYPNPPTYPMWDYNWAVHTFLWQTGVMTGLNDLSFGQSTNSNYPDPTNKLTSEGIGINREGVIVGYSHTNATAVSTGWAWHVGYDAAHALKFNGNAPIDLGIAPADSNSYTNAINDHGAIVGSGDYGQSAFFQVNGQTQVIAPAPGFSFASGLNNLDHVVGSSNNSLAFIWVPTSTLPENERIIDLTAMDLAEGVSHAIAFAINDRDQIVGSGDGAALLWQNGKLHRLNDVISFHPDLYLMNARAINQGGMIVANAALYDEGGVILLIPNELMVDANNDGKMSFTNAAVHNKDKTKKHSPYQFWVNDDRDEGDNDVPVEGLVDWTKDVIDQKRDLEDFARLWISFKGLTDLVKSPGVQLQLEWQPNDGTLPWRPAEGNPAIKLFPAAEPDGGRKYLDKNNWAETQSSTPYNATYGLVRRDFPLVLPLTQAGLGTLTEEQPNLYFLFEGVARGKGRLVLKLLKNSQTLAEYPPLYLDIKDVKDMYERWTVGDVTEPNTSVVSSLDYQVWPTTTATQDLGPSLRPLPAPTTDAERDYILLVHGWNTSPFDKGCTGNTAFKRLFWQGFRGRFGLFRWPTFHFEGNVPPIHHFDASEHRAWASSLGLLSLINQFNAGPFAGRVRIIAHSMGNVVVSEALRRSQAGQIVHTYIASQAAISAHCFDATTTLMTFRPNLGPTTPDVYGYYWQDGATSQPHEWQGEGRASYMHTDHLLGKAGRYFNYYNDRDRALDWPLWQLDQQTKPDLDYGYAYSGASSSRGFYRDPGYGATWLTFPTDRYEIFAWAAESRSYALGAQYVKGVVLASHGANVDLKGAPFNYGDTRKFHSAQFADTNAQRRDYWERILDSCGLLE
jgi:uncharacterized membrane protein